MCVRITVVVNLYVHLCVRACLSYGRLHVFMAASDLVIGIELGLALSGCESLRLLNPELISPDR